MIGSEDPEYQVSEEAGAQAAMQVYAYADELTARRRTTPTVDVLSVLLEAEVEGEKLEQMEIDLFFLLLIVAGNETTRNLMSGAMATFFEHPEQWERLREDRSLLPLAVEEMLRYVTPVMHFRRTATMDWQIGEQKIQEGDKVVFLAHLGQTETSGSLTVPTSSTSAVRRTTTSPSAAGGPTSASGPIWPAWRSWSCSTGCSIGSPTSTSTARSNASGPTSSTAPSTCRWPSRPRSR